ncbi:predicted protein [Coccidioides posadasii str. Silveira]|uniref:Predicted protein n=1 Tax=Coccidioides posadasii (strain RMSCC 757 / Silveira) TaxID=443226 RepID=E9DD85_COCPS|nr:predicted protein [Coccidioides posadasii str. Silveira]
MAQNELEVIPGELHYTHLVGINELVGDEIVMVVNDSPKIVLADTTFGGCYPYRHHLELQARGFKVRIESRDRVF